MLMLRYHENMSWAARTSRNKEFDAFETPEGRARLRSERIIHSLIDDILQSEGEGLLSACRDGVGGFVVRVELVRRSIRYNRTTYLSSREFDLLRNVPPVALLIGRRPEAFCVD